MFLEGSTWFISNKRVLVWLRWWSYFTCNLSSRWCVLCGVRTKIHIFRIKFTNKKGTKNVVPAWLTNRSSTDYRRPAEQMLLYVGYTYASNARKRGVNFQINCLGVTDWALFLCNVKKLKSCQLKLSHSLVVFLIMFWVGLSCLYVLMSPRKSAQK